MKNDRPFRLAHYKNGNYTVSLFSDGTKIKRTPFDRFEAEFPDSIDLKITDRCDMGCAMCHESSSVLGRHGDLSAPFLDTLRSGTELAIGGGDPLAHPRLLWFLERMGERGVICNLTVNEKHLLLSAELIEKMLRKKLVYGLGVSLNGCSDALVDFARKHSAVVIHVICGVVDEAQLTKLADKRIKLLVLGYKKFGRGKAYYSHEVARRAAWLKENIAKLGERFTSISFDNAAIEQLTLRETLPSRIFESGYMGDDGEASMYIDLVEERFAVTSVSDERFPITNSIDDMFVAIKSRG